MNNRFTAFDETAEKIEKEVKMIEKETAKNCVRVFLNETMYAAMRQAIAFLTLFEED